MIFEGFPSSFIPCTKSYERFPKASRFQTYHSKWRHRSQTSPDLGRAVLKKKMANLGPRAFSSFKTVDRRNSYPRLLNGFKNSCGFCHVKHDEMSSFCLNNGFRLQENNRAARRWLQPPKKPFHYVSRDKKAPRFLEYFSSLGQGFSNRPF